jgi:hypothetical protein
LFVASFTPTNAMGKSGKLRKRRRLQHEEQHGLASFVNVKHIDSKVATPSALATAGCTSSSSHAGDAISDLPGGEQISAADLAITIRTLNVLSANRELFRSKTVKPLRAALHTLMQEAAPCRGVRPEGRISDAFRDGLADEACRLLADMRNSSTLPKLGSVQRWIRDIDTVGSDTPDRLRLLDAVLRTADPKQIDHQANDSEVLSTSDMASGDLTAVSHNAKQLLGRVRLFAPFKAPAAHVDDAPAASGSSVVVVATTPTAAATIKIDQDFVAKHFTEVAVELAHQRTPPNRFDLHIFHSKFATIDLSSNHQRARSIARRHDVPSVPGAFVISDVLSTEECANLVATAEAVGYRPDEPLHGSESVLAHACVWLVDDDLCDRIYERCLPFLPPHHNGRAVAKINARWRFYRYVPGSVYRAHIDGAWPGSGVVDGKYHFDRYSDRWSMMTFLIYLNDDFDGGCTTFYLPSSKIGTLNARPVQPRTGSVLCFPHGEVGCLLHEGSGVLRGAKYVVRTDLLYMKAR